LRLRDLHPWVLGQHHRSPGRGILATPVPQLCIKLTPPPNLNPGSKESSPDALSAELFVPSMTFMTVRAVFAAFITDSTASRAHPTRREINLCFHETSAREISPHSPTYDGSPR
jgi:hypothetical protein